MGLNAKNAGNAGGNRIAQPIIEPGVYPARLVQILDLGVQAQRPYKGQEKPPAQELMLTYELVDVFMVDEEGNEVEDKPRWVSETFVLHNLKADKAKSTVRYHAFDPQENFEGDWSQCIGMPINVTLVNNASGDKVYTNVASVAAMRPKDADKCPELKNPSKVFDLMNPDVEVFNALPQWLQDKIKSNLNYQGSPLEAALAGGKPAKAPAKQAEKPKQAKDPAQQAFEEDDLPY